MSTNINALKKFIKELIKQELEEASTTGAIDGGEGPPKTPYAFSGEDDEEKKKKRMTRSTGYSVVKEAIDEKDVKIIKQIIRSVIADVNRDIWIKRNGWK